MIDKITEYRTKIAWIRQLMTMNESRELDAIWKKYALLRKLLSSVEENINELQIMETNIDGVKTKNYKIRVKRVSNELLKLSRATKEASG